MLETDARDRVIVALDCDRERALELAHEHQQDLKRVLPASLSRKQLIAMGDFFVSRLS